MTISLPKVSALLLLCVAAACGGTDAPALSNSFGASLSGAGEVPAVTTSMGSATATFTLSGTSVSYTITYSSLSAAPTGAHIHLGASTANGPVVIAFSGLPTTTSGTFSGTFTSADVKAQTSPAVTTLDDLVAQLRAGNAYTNMHTSNNPGGEVRGQIAVK